MTFNARVLKWLGSSLLFLCAMLAPLHAGAGDPYRIGVFYFPGWKNHQPGAPAQLPWQRIKAYPDREPLLGWYREGEVAVAEQQIQWMHDYGIDFVVYDWYWSGTDTFIEQGIQAYLKAGNNNLVQFSILWANHSEVPENLGQFVSMVQYWIKNYFNQSQYLKIDGKPVVYIFSQQYLRDNAKKFGKTTKELLYLATDMAKQSGYQGIYFVGSAEAVSYWVKDYGPKNGYDAFSAYNYHRGFSGKYLPDKPVSHSYEELDNGYRESWDWILANSKLPYMIPMTSGWDKRPWGGSPDPLHDDSLSTPAEFESHLFAAKKRIDSNRDKTLGMGVICCWNEFGEGSFIEPTKKYEFQYLEKIKKVFGSGNVIQ